MDRRADTATRPCYTGSRCGATHQVRAAIGATAPMSADATGQSNARWIGSLRPLIDRMGRVRMPPSIWHSEASPLGPPRATKGGKVVPLNTDQRRVARPRINLYVLEV